MNSAFIIQFAGSAVAVALLVALAAWLGRPKALPVLDDGQARALLSQEFPGRAVEVMWLTKDGRGAIARSGDLALVLCAVGDGFVARHLSWADALRSKIAGDQVVVDLHDFAAPRAYLKFETWPPVV